MGPAWRDLLFYSGNAYGPSGIIAGDKLAGVDRALLYPAMEAVSRTPMGHARGCLASTYKFLTIEAVKAQAVMDAIAADRESAKLTSLKEIRSVTAKDPKLKLPAKTTELVVDGDNRAGGDTIYTWRKIHGAGKVDFGGNGAAAAKTTKAQFDGKPGKYLFEVTMSDPRGLTEERAQVGVILTDSKGLLPANRPPTAAAQSFDIPQSTTTSITLRATDPERLELVYTITKKPEHGRLSGEAPKLIYTPDYGYSGADGFTFRVTDSEGQTAETPITLKVDSKETLQLAIYEPFDYPPSLLKGCSGNREVGFDGAWDAHKDNATITSGSLPMRGISGVWASASPWPIMRRARSEAVCRPHISVT